MKRLVPLAEQMKDDAEVWSEMAARHGLAEVDLARLASPWHTDADLGRPIEVVTDMSKSRRMGCTGYAATDAAFFDLFERLRADKIIPARRSRCDLVTALVSTDAVTSRSDRLPFRPVPVRRNGVGRRTIPLSALPSLIALICCKLHEWLVR